jgi:hypothetical protein
MPAPRIPHPDPPFLPQPCRHTRVQVVARQQGRQYFECLDCRSILEADDLDSSATDEELDGV